MKIILSRTDSIGDVVLSLPMAGVLRQQFPGCHIVFLGRKYTRPIIEACRFVNEFLDWDEISATRDPSSVLSGQASAIRHLQSLQADMIVHVFPVKAICRAAKQAGIPIRIATSNRFYTWFYCNRLLRVPRKNSGLHEAQLNLKLLKPLGITKAFSTEEIPEFYGLTAPSPTLPQTGEGENAPLPDKFNLILHPKSKGSAREWGLENFSRLIGLLPPEKFNLFVSGTAEEGNMMRDFLNMHQERVQDLTGKLSLSEFIQFICSCDGIVAASTGPLHIAAAFGKHAIGLYAPMRPIFPQRWAPLGKNARFLVLDKNCQACRKTENCECIRQIRAEDVAEILFSLRPC